MKVSVSCAGRFHAFELVEQLHRRGHLHAFLTSTTNDRLFKNRSLPAALRDHPEFLRKIHRIPLPEYLGHIVRRLPLRESQAASYFVKDNLYDRRASRHIGHSDLFVGWASQSLFQLREAKARGAISVIERGSCHIERQSELVDRERAQFGLNPDRVKSFDRLLIDKQLKEYHEADYIMVPSEFARESFLQSGFAPERILKVPYGVNLDRFTPKSEYRLHGPLKIIHVGAIGFQKGIPHLLGAVDSIKRRGLAVELTLVGRIETEFESWLNQTPLRTHIDRHLGFISNSELPELLKQHDVFCLASVQEGLALSLLEAMGCGLAVIATSSTGAEEFVSSGENGTVVVPSDPNALDRALASYYDDRELLELHGRKAATTAAIMTWDRYGTEIEKTYTALLRRKSSVASGDVKAFYTDYWDREKSWTPSHSFTEEQLETHFGGVFRPTDSVLDVGCGDASNYQSWLVGKVAMLSAIDISETGIARATSMGIDARLHDLAVRFPFADDSFDAATCVEVLEHLYDPKFCVREIFRVLKPGGIAVISVPNSGYIRDRLNMLTKAQLATSITDLSNEWNGAHIRFYSLDSMSRMLEVAGFTIESVRSNGESSVFDSLESIGGYTMQHITSLLRRKLPRALRLAFLENVWPSLFAPHIILHARKLL